MRFGGVRTFTALVFSLLFANFLSGQQILSGQLDEQLRSVALGHDTAKAQLLLAQGASVRAPDKNGDTALYWAIYGGDAQMVKLLLSNGADANAKDSGGNTPLAFGLGLSFLRLNPDIASLLLNAKPDRQVVDDALIYAAGKGDTQGVKLLLEKGAHIDGKNKDGETALTRAVWQCQAETVKLLLEKGASPGLKNAQHDSALSLAAAHERNLVVSAADPDNAEYRIADVLLDMGANVDEPDDFGRTPLLSAVERGDIPLMKLLLRKGANVGYKDHNGDSPLRHGLISDSDTQIENPDVAALLLDNASTDLRDDVLNLALVDAAHRGDKVEVQLLLDKGAKIDAKTSRYGSTALISAVERDQIETVKLLLDNGADPSATNGRGQTALTIAAGSKWDTTYKPDARLLDLLRNAHRTARQELHEEVARLAGNPNDDALREQIIKDVASINPPPAIPDEARKALVEGATLMKSMHTLDDFLATKDKFETAIEKAPYWADAYYDYASALEQMGWYADAAKQLKRYLLFDVPSDEAQRVRDRITALDTQRELAERSAEEEQRKERMKYVMGGARRINSGEAPSDWKAISGSERLGIEGTYAYTFGSHYDYPNVFQMPNGHYIAATLVAMSSSSGGYAGDQVFITDITHADNVRGRLLAFGTVNDHIDLSGFAYKVSISDRNRDGVITVLELSTGAGFTLPIANLYIARYMGTINSRFMPNFDLGYAPGSDTMYALLFNNKLTSSGCFGKCAPNVDQDPLSLTPTYVFALDRKDGPIGNSGYFIHWHGQAWNIEK